MEQILIEQYDYPLPDERIAKYPLTPRDSSKLLIYRQGKIIESTFHHIGDYLPNDALLVYNNTKVIQARLVFHKNQHDDVHGARIEIFCLEPIAPHDYTLSLGCTDGCVWKCMIGNLKKWKNGSLHLTTPTGCTLTAERLSTTGNTHHVRFSWDTTDMSFAEILDQLGELPIPPYLNRKTEESDKTTYQTVYSRIKGSVAAPTAGLHFTDEVLSNIRQRGITLSELTLHVGAGTFQPVKVADANQHTMHTEVIAVPKTTLLQILHSLGHIAAVGTTSMRTLESLYYLGEKVLNSNEENLELHVDQFEPYTTHHTITTIEALQNLINYLDRTHQDVLHAETQIMIRPGFDFRMVDMLITNFHQPKSTLLLLVSAFVNGNWKSLYHYALDHDFRFLSYGDSSILYRDGR